MTKARLKITEEDNRSLKWEHEVLEQRFEKVGSLVCMSGYSFKPIVFWIKYFLEVQVPYTYVIAQNSCNAFSSS